MKEKHFFVSQMHYNRAICYLMLSEYAAAIKALEQCKIEEESKTYSRWVELLNALKNKKTEAKNFEIFSQKNKISRSLNEISIKLSNNLTIKLKLSIPFPKVEPPEINPKFEIKILREINL